MAEPAHASIGHEIRIEPASEHVRVELDGVVLAETTRARVLHETGIRDRWYIPKEDVRMDLLEPTDNASHCPFKGDAEYWSARIGDRLDKNIAWSYRTPIPQSADIAGLIAFYDERADLIVISGSPDISAGPAASG